MNEKSDILFPSLLCPGAKKTPMHSLYPDFKSRIKKPFSKTSPENPYALHLMLMHRCPKQKPL